MAEPKKVSGRPLLARLHEHATVEVLQPLHQTYRWMRPAYRPALEAYRDGMDFRRLSADWPEHRRSKWLLDALRSAIRRAYAETEFYRDRMNSLGFDPNVDFSLDDFSQLPVLEREDIRAAGTSIRSRAVPLGQVRRDSTGGSSGEPTEVWRGPEELGWNESGTEYFMRSVGLPRGTSTGLLWGHHLDPVASDRLRDRLHFAAENLRWYDCLRVSPEIFEKYHAELSRWRPTCIIAYAGALGAFAEFLQKRGVERPSYPGRAFVTGAEKLLPHHRAAVETVFNRPDHERYGSRDVALLGFQTHPGRSLDYALDWANVFVEPETTDPESPILVTKLHADAMPMIRYRIGDMARFPDGSAPGRPVMHLHEVLGREVDRVWLPDGRWVSGLSFPHLMKDYGVRLFQIVQAADFSVRVDIVPAADFRLAAADEILRLVRANLKGIRVEINVVEDIQRTRANKWLPVVSHVEIPISRRAD